VSFDDNLGERAVLTATGFRGRRSIFRFHLTALRQNLGWTLLPRSPHRGLRETLVNPAHGIPSGQLPHPLCSLPFFQTKQYGHERTGKWIAKSRQLGYEQKKQERAAVME
jgi:hypothetical protein